MGKKIKNIHYLYKTTCLINGRYYIGMHSTDKLEDGYLGSGLRLRRSIRKYGVDNHKKEILEFFESRELLIDAEKKIIVPEMLSDEKCMNLMCGGKGGFISEEQQRHRSICGGQAFAKKLLSDENFKEKHKQQVSKNMSHLHKVGKIKPYDWTGKKHTEETKKLMSNIKKNTGIGILNSQYGTCWITKDGDNRKIKKDELHIWINEGWSKGRK